MTTTPLRADELAALWSDEIDAPMQIGLLALFDARSTDVGPASAGAGRSSDSSGATSGAASAEEVAGHLARRAMAVPELCRRIDRPGARLRRPAWREISATEVAARVSVVAPEDAPGDEAALHAWAVRRTAEVVDLAGPPWRIEVVGPTAQGHLVVLVVVHHAVVDGQGGLDVMRRLFDAPDDARAPITGPSARAPGRVVPGADVGPPGVGAADGGPPDAGAAPGMFAALRGREPSAALPRRVGPGRRLVVVRRPLAVVQRAARADGVTLNDLVLAAFTAGLRERCRAVGVLRDDLVLRTSVPVATAAGGQVMSIMLVPLPVGEADPQRRLALLRSVTATAKARVRSGAGGTMPDPGALVMLGRPVVRALRRFGTGRVTASVTNVRGPAVGPRLLGLPLLELVPLGPLAARTPFTVAALSCAGRLVVAVTAAGEVSALQELWRGLEESLAR